MDVAYNFVKGVTMQGEKIYLWYKNKPRNRFKKKLPVVKCLMLTSVGWGMLTNFKTIRNRINRLVELEQMEDEGLLRSYPRKKL